MCFYNLNKFKNDEIFNELEGYGGRHDDQFLRNITYRLSDGKFCVIDFEFSIFTVFISEIILLFKPLSTLFGPTSIKLLIPNLLNLLIVSNHLTG